jgi:ethanolamine utilization protein EutP (predicted NTPase)
MGIVTPLQLIAVTGLLDNQGLKPLPAALTTALAAFNSTTLITNFNAAVAAYLLQPTATNSTLASLLSIGNNSCPALGNSIPVAYTNLVYPTAPTGSITLRELPTSPYGFSGLIQQTGSAYLGNGDIGRFAQGFLAVQGYVSTVNSFVNSVDNSQTYLGPTFTTMSNLVTNNIGLVTTDIPKFAVDLRNTGLLINTGNLELFGTPAGLLQQLATVSGATGSSLPGVIDQLKNTDAVTTRSGLTDAEINSLVSDNRVSLFNPRGISTLAFDQLQKTAYQAITQVRGAELQDVLSVLEISTPNIETMADLLDLEKIMPNSYQTLQVPTAFGSRPIYLSDGAVDQTLAPIVNQILPAPSGCDELGKIIPPANAVSNKAFQSALQQVTNIAQTPAPDFAVSMVDLPRTPWTNTVPYQANAVVALAPAAPAGPAQLLPDTVFYRAQQDVDAGTAIVDTDYWQPYTPDGISTMADLPLIEALTAAVPADVAAAFNAEAATGTGPNGTVTICDVIGTATDHWDFAARLTSATAAINTLQTAGSLTTLNNAYIAIAGAANDAAVITQINNANAAIAALSANAQVPILNTAWNYIANYLNREKGFQNQSALNYFELVPDEKVSVYALTQSLGQFGTQSQACGPNQFLQDIVDQTTLTGQAVVGALREGQNQAQLAAAGLQVDITPNIAPEITPPIAVTPVT